MNCSPILLTRLKVLSLALLVAFFAGTFALAQEPTEQVKPGAKAGKEEATAYKTRSLQGRVVWLAEALARRHGIQTVAEAGKRVLALETKDGKLVPLIEDKRGRSFRLDKRLRGIDVELLVRQYDGVPFVQVIQIFALKEDGKYELDYWCEICAIAMFELKACDCCQGDIELRARKVTGTAPSQ